MTISQTDNDRSQVMAVALHILYTRQVKKAIYIQYTIKKITITEI